MPRDRELGSWHSGAYVARWAEDDVLAGVLTIPRNITAAIVAESRVPVTHVLDLGSGGGGYLGVLLESFPDARGTWVDSSGPMGELAREHLRPFGERISYVFGDLERLEVLALADASVVLTSRVVHDLPPEAQRRFYRAAFELVEPGGFLFNLDHFGAPSDWEERYREIRARFTGRRQRPLAPHRAHALTALEAHLGWIEAAGFEPPDVPWRLLLTALVAARRRR